MTKWSAYWLTGMGRLALCRLALCMLALCMLALPNAAVAHGDEAPQATIDEHHAELRASLQMTLGDAYDAPVPGLGTADTAAGQALYEQHCASCHGTSGKGDGSAAGRLPETPSDLTNGDQMKFISDAGFVEVIRSGLTDAGMPAYGTTLSETELVQVYAYTKTLRVETATEDSHACSVGPVGGRPSSTGWLPLALALAALSASRIRRGASA